MRGRITSRERCPVCGAKGKWHIQAHGRRQHLVCQCGGWEADRPELYMKWRGRPIRITHDQAGQRFATLAQAQAAQTKINEIIADPRRRFDPGQWARRPELLFEVALEKYLARYKASHPPSSYRAKRSYARHLAYFNGRNLSDLTLGDLEDYSCLPCLHICLAPRTINHVLKMLDHLLQDLVRRGQLENAPRAPRLTVSMDPIKHYSPAEISQLLAHAGHHRPIIEWGVLYGWRPGELVALNWDAVDLVGGEVWCRRTWSAGRGIIETTKTRRSRPLPIYDRARDILKQLPRGLHQAPVFVNPDTGRRYSTRRLNEIYHQIRRAAGLRNIPFKNATRHTWAMLQFARGVDAALVSYGLGHTKIQTTLDAYGQPQVPRLKEALDVGYLLATGLETQKGDK